MLKRAALASMVGLCVVRGLAGCGGTLQCRAEAVLKVIPEDQDPDEISLGDLKDAQQRVKACKAQAPDAGR